MKRFLLLWLCFAGLAFDTDLGGLTSEAQRDYQAGDLANAKTKFALVLKADPRNTAARNYLRLIQARETQQAGPSLKSSLSKVVLAKVSFQDASFGAALDFLKQQAAKQNAPVSFVYQVPREKLETAKISLNLANVPFLSALNYACQLARMEYVIQPYAVLIRPIGAPEVPPTPATSTNVQ